MEEFIFKSADGKDVHVFSHLAAQSPKAVVQIVHGLAEHAQRYENFARHLNSAGYLVYAADQRGHGKTAGSQADYGYVGEDGFNRAVEDEKALTGLIRKRHPGLPVFLLGHSYGSFLSQEYVINRGDLIDGLILSGSAAFFKMKPKLIMSGLIAALIKIFKGERHRSKFIDNTAFGTYNKRIPDAVSYYAWLSSDEATVAAYDADEYCGGIFTLNFYKWFAKGLIALSDKKRIMNIRKQLPVLVTSGSEDPVGGYGELPTMLADAYRAAGMTDVELKIYDGMRHEILNEKDRARVYADITDWLDKHIAQ